MPPPSSELAPTGKVRVGIAVAPTPGAGNVARDADGGYRGVAVDLGRELAAKLGVPAELVPYPNSGALTDAAASGAWDVAFLPVDAQRKTKVDFGSAHIVLQSTYLVAPGSADRRARPTRTRPVCAWPASRIRRQHGPRRRRSRPSP